MRRRISYLLVALAAVTLLAGMSIARAQADQKKNYYDIFIDKVAQLLGKSPADVEKALIQAKEQVIDQAVKDGAISQERAEKIKQRIERTGKVFPIITSKPRLLIPRVIQGNVKAVTSDSIDVETNAGKVWKVNIQPRTKIVTAGRIKQAAVQVGDRVKVVGKPQGNSINARVILINNQDTNH